ncbi:MAG: vitamin B12 dependent-methionine synthase activation domain-containing protein [Candidatus Aminicenantes bacterium]
MMILDPVPVTLDTSEVEARLRFDATRAGFPSLEELIGLARDLMRPKAVFVVAYTGAKGDRTVEVSGVAFESSLLRKNLEPVNKVFPYIITVGAELERAAAAQGDLLKQYFLEGMADLALEQAASWLSARFEERFGVTGLANMSPGSLEDWPITEQRKLFSIFGDTEKAVGVRLTDSLLMIPRKSISGILFPSEEGFVACQLCDRGSCPSRKSAFDPREPGRH